MTKEEVLQKCTIEGNVVKLPAEQLDRKLYMDVAKALNLIGGAWKGGKVSGFVFPNDPTDLLNQIAYGEKRNLKKEFQFFATSDDLSDELVEYADIKDEHDILEPSAGQGAIIKAINRKLKNKKVDCYELMEINQTFLTKIKEANFIGDDFLKANNDKKYDRIIANPPFAKNQDITHISEMYEHLKVGGRLVSISSRHWQTSKNKKETQFRNWLTDIKAEIVEVDAGRFKESGTSISTLILIINK